MWLNTRRHCLREQSSNITLSTLLSSRKTKLYTVYMSIRAPNVKTVSRLQPRIKITKNSTSKYRHGPVLRRWASVLSTPDTGPFLPGGTASLQARLAARQCYPSSDIVTWHCHALTSLRWRRTLLHHHLDKPMRAPQCQAPGTDLTKMHILKRDILCHINRNHLYTYTYTVHPCNRSKSIKV